jgi:hypothetical protein
MGHILTALIAMNDLGENSATIQTAENLNAVFLPGNVTTLAEGAIWPDLAKG